jgi:putative flavoprotein involved in K+ transport
LYGNLLGLDGSSFQVAHNLEECLDNADKTSESIKNSIDAFVTKNGIYAPIESRYNPLWAPKSAQRSTIVRPGSHRSSGASAPRRFQLDQASGGR